MLAVSDSVAVTSHQQPSDVWTYINVHLKYMMMCPNIDNTEMIFKC